MPSGRFLMEEFYYAGGLPAVLRRLGEHGLLPHPDALTVNGQSALGQRAATRRSYNDEVIRPLDKPLIADGGIRVLRGNLAPRGAVLKPSAATPELLQHRGRAVVFENLEHYKARIVDAALDVDADSVLVLKNCGPQGLSRHGRGRQHGPAAQAAAPGREGHGAHLRRAHERHRLRHGGAARRARGRAPAGRWRRCATATGSSSTATRGRLHLDITDAELADARWRPAARRTPAATPAATSGCTSTTCCRPTKAATSTSCVGCRGAEVPRHSH